MRVLIGAFGDPGHAFPAIALARALHEREHEVLVQTWKRWQPYVEREGIGFDPSPEYDVFPTRSHPLKPYEAVVRATAETRPLVREFAPDVVVNDILTLAPALAAELEGRPRATLVPHVYPPTQRGLPAYGLGAMPPTSRAGRAAWRALSKPMNFGVARGRDQLNETRRRLGLPPTPHSYGGMSRELTLVATFPQLEYVRRWPDHVYVSGPLVWEPPHGPTDPPPGNKPLVLVAPSTSQDQRQTMLVTALRALANLPVRVLATYNRRPPPGRVAVPANARLVEWVSYSQTMPLADLVLCHGGHGTMARALSCGKPVVVVPGAGDMAENAARLQWAGAGLALPRRLMTAAMLRWVVQRGLEEPDFAARARELAQWASANDGAATAAALIEWRFGRAGQPPVLGSNSMSSAASRS
ncbi:MAG: nucleotide disphospho-sugar-binding domain-containing protein [Solirubrobacterales bacterium]